MSTAVPTQCQICKAQPQKYSCPRCNILYCSVACYKAESHAQCSETFYKDSVLQEMAMLGKRLPAGLVDSAGSDEGNSAEVRRMYEILKRMENGAEGEDDEDEGPFEGDEDEELDSDDDELDSALADRLQDIDLNDANAVWARLTDAERHEFESLVHGDDINTLLEVKVPWWMPPANFGAPKTLIEDISDGPQPQSHGTTATTPHTDDIPPLYARIAPFAQLSGKAPAPCVAHNLRNVLAAYALTYRYFNGDHHGNAVAACSHLLLRSANLRANQNFEESAVAMQATQPDASAAEWSVIAADVEAMLLGGAGAPANRYALAALSDVHRLLGAARKATTASVVAEASADGGGGGAATTTSEAGEFSRRFQDHETIDAELVSRGKLSACAKKVEYYLAYVKEFN